MGMAARWLKNLLKYMKKGKGKTEKNTTVSVEAKEKKIIRCSSIKTRRSDSNRSNHDALMNVRTQKDYYSREAMTGGVRAQIWAAVKIQTVFRGLLARKALRGLRGIVKLQALVRGHIVRKRLFARMLRNVDARARARAALLALTKVQSAHCNRDRMMRARTSSENDMKCNRRFSSYHHNPYCDYDWRRRIETEITPRLSCSRMATKKKLCDDCSFANPNYNFEGPSYMATTVSFRGKLRCQSVPKQRSDPAGCFGSKNAEVLYSSSGRF